MTGATAGLALFGAGAFLLPFLRLRPHRAATGEGIALAAALPAGAWAAGIILGVTALALAATALPRRASPRDAAASGASGAISGGGAGAGGAAARPSGTTAVAAAAILAGPLLLLALSRGSAALAGGAPAMARVSFGAGFWLAGVGAWLLARGAARLPGHRDAAASSIPRVAAAASLATAAILALAGGFGDLALAREFANRRGLLGEALLRHLAYALFPTLAASLIALPLGRAAARRPAVEGPLFIVATAAQTIPTLSLLGLLVLPLTALRAALPILGAIGLSGVGWAPASIALFLYAILPLAANARAGFALVSPAARDAARGLGMSERELFRRVDLPLAAPALIAGFRTALAQNLGNAVLAGLIGGGGLGGVIFLGLAQAAPDLVLLGALPVVAAAFLADRLLGGLERAAAARTGAAPSRDAAAEPRRRSGEEAA